MAKTVLNNYQKVQANTASPAQRVIMVYSAISKHIKAAIAACDDDSPERFSKIHNAITNAEQLITELQVALDKENGGEIANNLDSLYVYWKDTLSDANVNKSPAKMRQVNNMVKELLESWEKAAKEVKKQQ